MVFIHGYADPRELRSSLHSLPPRRSSDLMYSINIIFAFVGAKLCKANWEDAAIASLATIGGPPTAASFAVSSGWTKMVIPGMLVGLWGYVVGNYFGIFVGNLLGIAIR